MTRPALLHPEAEAYRREVEAASVALRPTLRMLADRRYGDHPRQVLDVHLPASDAGRGTWPLLWFLHGGAWRNGGKDWIDFMAPAVTALPAILVSINYRLAPEHRLPAGLLDTVQALGWIRAHASSVGGDAARLFVGGHSAGGHLAALASLRGDLWAGQGLATPPLAGCIALSAPLDLRLIGPYANEPTQLVVHREVLADSADAEALSPICQIDGSDIPFLLAWGENDFPRILAQNRIFAAALGARPGRLVAAIEMKRTGHFESHLRCIAPGSGWREAVGAFLRGGNPLAAGRP